MNLLVFMSTIGIAPTAPSWSQPRIFTTAPATSENTQMSTEEFTYLSICAIALLFLVGTFILKRKS